MLKLKKHTNNLKIDDKGMLKKGRMKERRKRGNQGRLKKERIK